jgi:hypothetical protein
MKCWRGSQLNLLNPHSPPPQYHLDLTPTGTHSSYTSSALKAPNLHRGSQGQRRDMKLTVATVLLGEWLCVQCMGQKCYQQMIIKSTGDYLLDRCVGTDLQASVCWAKAACDCGISGLDLPLVAKPFLKPHINKQSILSWTTENWILYCMKDFELTVLSWYGIFQLLCFCHFKSLPSFSFTCVLGPCRNSLWLTASQSKQCYQTPWSNAYCGSQPAEIFHNGTYIANI